MSTKAGPPSTIATGTRTSRPAGFRRSAALRRRAPSSRPPEHRTRAAMRSSTVVALTIALLGGPALAKLPPLDAEAKAKAAEAAAKAAWSAKVNAYKVCQIEDRLAKRYRASANDAPAPI